MVLIKVKHEDKIRASLIFEILGRPAEHIKETLEQLIETLGKNEGIQIISKQVHEAKPVEDEEAKGANLFTTFGETEVELDNLNLLFQVIINMMPANVEILEPKELRLKNFELGEIISQLIVKMHKFDEIANAFTIERGNMSNQIKQMDEKIKELESKTSNKEEGNKKESEKDNDSEKKNKSSDEKSEKKNSNEKGKKDEKK